MFEAALRDSPQPPPNSHNSRPTSPIDVRKRIRPPNPATVSQKMSAEASQHGCVKQHCMKAHSPTTTSPIGGHVSKRIRPPNPATPSPIIPGCNHEQADQQAAPTDDDASRNKHTHLHILADRCKPGQARQADQPAASTNDYVSQIKHTHPDILSDRCKPGQARQARSPITANVSQKRLTPSHTLARKTSPSIPHRSCNTTNIDKTWQELTKNTNNEIVMMTVVDLGTRRTTREKFSKNKPKEEQEAATRTDEARKNKNTDEIPSKENMKKTSPVKTASNKRRQPNVTNSPVMKNLKRLKPRTMTDIACRMNDSHHKLQNSPRKSVNFKSLVSNSSARII